MYTRVDIGYRRKYRTINDAATGDDDRQVMSDCGPLSNVLSAKSNSGQLTNPSMDFSYSFLCMRLDTRNVTLVTVYLKILAVNSNLSNSIRFL